MTLQRILTTPACSSRAERAEVRYLMFMLIALFRVRRVCTMLPACCHHLRPMVSFPIHRWRSLVPL